MEKKEILQKHLKNKDYAYTSSKKTYVFDRCILLDFHAVFVFRRFDIHGNFLLRVLALCHLELLDDSLFSMFLIFSGPIYTTTVRMLEHLISRHFADHTFGFVSEKLYAEFRVTFFPRGSAKHIERLHAKENRLRGLL